ncbi:inositol monophosphatase [Leeia sp. TBRC 13508]|uniref:Inositol-1-monophosphatase n=1 Tax=Leeia speluncae TaxID=2884804 RepID=A0ABS8D2V9_9NEIS|nr:inositol monophosphatase family protein [Leeia speluncae]MCB6182522.1 inositol monophosphatase [Leeia speluncae]
MQSHPMLNIAVKAARRAASVITRASRNLDTLTVQSKQPNDLVSEVDRAAEATIIQTIQEAYPDHAILAEESGQIGDSEYVWVIDPLDGTTNFLHGFPHYCVSIALLHKGVPTQAVVYDPNRNHLFTASRGAGAFLDGRRIRVSKKTQLSEALLSTGFPYRELENLDTYVTTFKEFTLKSQGIRRPGSAALDLAYIAAGWVDGFWEFGLAPWDIAAGALLIKEAGGLVTDFAGEEGFMESGNVLAGTPRVFGQMLQVLQPLLPKPVDPDSFAAQN